MIYLSRLFFHNLLFIKILIWLRGLLSENRIPETLFERLKHYLPELSENIPDIKAINKYLRDDINYLNSREELISYHMTTEKSTAGNDTHIFLGIIPCKHHITKYKQITIIGYKDIIELDSIRDRIFIFDIDMESDKSDLYIKSKYQIDKPLYFKIALSTLSV